MYRIDYHNKKLVAYTLHDFLEGIHVLYESNYVIHDPQSTAVKVANMYSVSFIQSEEGKALAEQEQQLKVQEEKEDREKELSALIALLSDDNLDKEAKKVFPEFKEFAEKFNVTDRGAVGLKKKLKEVRDELLSELEGLG